MTVCLPMQEDIHQMDLVSESGNRDGRNPANKVLSRQKPEKSGFLYFHN